MTAVEYIEAIDVAVRGNRFYFPPDRDERKRRLLSLAREIGYALAAWDDNEIQRVVTTTYGRIVARNSLDSVGVVINNNEWVREIHRGINARRDNARTTHLNHAQ